MSLTNALIWTISLGSIALMLVRPGGWSEAYWVCGGALILVGLGLLPLAQAGGAIAHGADVYLFLAGMMILSELAREKGVFAWIAEIAAEHAAGSAARLFLLIYLAGLVVTALLSNDATAVVLTPAVLTLVRRLKIEPKPHLLACALIANAASFILPISNPANLVIFQSHLPPLSLWLRAFLAPSLGAIGVTYFCLRGLMRRELRAGITEVLPRGALGLEGKLALAGLFLAAAVLLSASALGWTLGAPTFLAALLAAAMVTIRDPKMPAVLGRGVAWSILPLVAGLFVLVEALTQAGAGRLVADGLRIATHLSEPWGDLATAFCVGIASNVLNNLPVGLIGGAALSAVPHAHRLDAAVLIGVDLGPNLSVTGSLATVLWLIALRREKVEITAWQFLKVGAITMPLSLLGTVLALALAGLR